MIKKLSGILTAVFILLACVLTSACGDKYKKLEFKVYYSYSIESGEWFDGTNGISLNYSEEEFKGNASEGKSSLVFVSGVATLYVKVEVQNVKSKHLDLITISPTSLSCFNLSKQHVKSGEVVEFKITNSGSSTLKLYENNSGKRAEVPFTVSRTLTNIEADLSKQPAMYLNGGINLALINNLIYAPYEVDGNGNKISITNQQGVKYSVSGIGYYNNEHVFQYTKIKEQAEQFIEIDGTLLSVKDSSFFTNQAHIIKVKATSIYFDGTVEGKDEISTEFDVYVVNNSIAHPDVHYVALDGTTVGESIGDDDLLQIYENGLIGEGKDYSNATVVVDTTGLVNDVYFANLNTHDGSVKYSTQVYVENEHGGFKKYIFDDKDFVTGINGLIVQKGELENSFKVSIANRQYDRNQVKFVYVIEGLDFSASTKQVESSKKIEVFKGILPKSITVNRTTDLKNGEVEEANVYATNSGYYKGLELVLNASPNDDKMREIKFENEDNGLILTNGRNQNIESVMDAGVVYVKFKPGVAEEQELKIKTLSVPTEYNGEPVLESDYEYITVTYKLKKVVTADSLEFVENEESGAETVSNVVVNANGKTDIFVKVKYSGVTLDGSSVKLTSNNPALLFENNTQQMTLGDIESLRTDSVADGKISIFKIPVNVNNQIFNFAEISIVAGEGLINVDSTVFVSSVHLMEDEDVNIQPTSSNVITQEESTVFGVKSFNFAMGKGEYSEFKVVDGKGLSQTISSLTMTRYDLTATDIGNGFSNSALSYNIISNSVFVVSANSGDKTQLINLRVSYFKLNNGRIGVAYKDVVIQIAVFDAIGNIDVSLTKESIGYVNDYYTEISSTAVEFGAYTKTYGTPAQDIKFKDDLASEDIKTVEKATQLKISVNNYSFLNNQRAVDIKYVKNDQYLINSQNVSAGKESITIDDLSGRIEIDLKGIVNVEQIKLTISALRFGTVSNVIANVIIKVAEVDKATGIIIDTENFTNSTGGNELKMTFIDVPNGGYDEATFKTSLKFDSLVADLNKIRFDNIETALTHILYQYKLDNEGRFTYETDENGNRVIATEKIPSDFLTVTYENVLIEGVRTSLVRIKALKENSGGRFKLVLATKDSFIGEDITSANIEEKDFTTTKAIDIFIQDGEVGSEYLIDSVDMLKAINYNLDANFILDKDLEIEEDWQPIGVVEGVDGVSAFRGSLSGTRETRDGEQDIKRATYSITYKISDSKKIKSSEYDYLAGLFGVIGANAQVKDLEIRVSYDEFKDNNGTDINIGALAGVNLGTIDNVNIKIDSSINIGGNQGVVNLGGIVGLNEKIIKNSTVKCLEEITIQSSATSVHNIGLIAGTNDKTGKISGTYIGKESLHNFIYDIVANVNVIQTSTSTNLIYYLGSAAGTNKGLISNLLVGGKISFTSEVSENKGYLGGIAGLSSKVDENLPLEIQTVTAMALDLKATNMNVGGIVGTLNNGSAISNVKFVSVDMDFGSVQTKGTVDGNLLVSGVVANSNGGILQYATVENFINNHNTIQNGTTAAGLVASGSSTTTDSLVKANIKSNGTVYSTAETERTNTFFIGNLYSATGGTVEDKSAYNNLSNYKIDNNYTIPNTTPNGVIGSVTVSEETTDWTNIYMTLDNVNYIKADEFIEDNDIVYVSFDKEAWINCAKSLISGTWTDIIDVESGEIVCSTNGNWTLRPNYNVVNVKGVELWFPYLTIEHDHDSNLNTEDETEALMIVEPQTILANINQDYNSKPNSIYVPSFNIGTVGGVSYDISESYIVNFLRGGSDEVNAHYLVNGTKVDGIAQKGIVDTDIIPEDAQGGYAFRIVQGDSYAYINDKKQIVFYNKASGKHPIIVEIYSVFKPDVNVYVALYSQSLATSLNLSSSSLNYVNEVDYTYEMNAYTGQGEKILALNAENRNYLTIFNIHELSEYLTVEAVSDAINSKLDINTSAYNNMTLKIKDGVIASVEEQEIVRFRLKLRKEYFANDYVTEDVLIGEVSMLVHLYNSASNIEVDGEDIEIASKDDFSFGVYLTTDYFDKNHVEGEYETTVQGDKNENINHIVMQNVGEHDSIKITLEIIEGKEQIETLLRNTRKTLFADLFDRQVIISLYRTNGATGKVLGYYYNVNLELKNQRDYKYITNSIKFNIYITAISNPDVNSKENPLSVEIKPTSAMTARFENYTINDVRYDTDYTNIISNTSIETSIIEPGSLGNLMMIYLEPSYSNVVSASIKTSSLYVPSLSKDVKLRFTQLVLDYRNDPNGKFTTLYGGDYTAQEDNTLDLKPISVIDAQNRRDYTGVICVYIQLEEFSGLEASMEIELNVETNNGTKITRTKTLLTTYLPDVILSYDNSKQIDDGYLIQKGTSNNEVSIKIYGYQYNDNPDLHFEWALPANSSQYEYYEDAEGKVYKHKIRPKAGGDVLLIGNYVDDIMGSYADAVYDGVDGSYTITLKLNISENIPAPFKVGVGLSLVTRDGQLKSINAEENTLTFYPTQFILKSAQVAGLVEGNKKNAIIDTATSLDLIFETDNTSYDYSDHIYAKLLEYATIAGEGEFDSSKIAEKFNYYSNGNLTFASAHPEFDFRFVNNSQMTIEGNSDFLTLVTFRITYGYYDADGDGVYEFRFGSNQSNVVEKSLEFAFMLNIFGVEADQEIIIYTAEQLYNASSGSWNLEEGKHYVLMNDIELENVVPITTPIAGFDGNNRVISIKSFMASKEVTNYGLFGEISTYKLVNEETLVETIHQTILKNVIVDYSKFDGTLALIENEEVVFGGLVGKNDGGLIYNCDVINLNQTKTAELDLVVSGSAKVTFGGLVGENKGIITNSRVGRSSYDKITAAPELLSVETKNLGSLTFKIYNKKENDSEINQFTIVSGGFVGTNSGTISTSYVEKTNLLNYSTNETLSTTLSNNITAGFVGTNSGTISYSFAKADDNSISATNSYSTGYAVENRGNGIVSGFVYYNTGNINNSYANIELKTLSAYVSGFVYNNAGTITESYSSCSMNGGTDTYAEQPFIGVDSQGKLLSTGKLENTYYLMRSANDNPIVEEGKDFAQGMNAENFANSEYLVGFSFVLSSAREERAQGIWSYYTLNNQYRVLPELINATLVSHSYRYVVDKDTSDETLINARSYELGTVNNPFIISSVEDYNNIFTNYGETPNNQDGYIRFINNINFADDKTAISTRVNYTLGSNTRSTKTSVEGNGLTISGIYLDANGENVEKIGLFAEIRNAYVKNLNLKFAKPETESGMFSTTTATYSGGLAGKIVDSSIINITLAGTNELNGNNQLSEYNTILAGRNFVGGLAGLISGSSLIYNIETNLNVSVGSEKGDLYYSENDYDRLNIGTNYNNYLTTLSYGGGLAGVLDLNKINGIKYNVQFIDIRGDRMVRQGNLANISAIYAGGVAGYANENTSAYKLRYMTGTEELIQGYVSAGGLFGVYLGTLTASQVTAEEDIQYGYDTETGKYVISLGSTEIADINLNLSGIGNTALIKSNNYAGGLIGVGLNSTIDSCYSKVGFENGNIIGGLIGLSVSTTTSYSYSIPYVDVNKLSNTAKVGGLIGEAYGIRTTEEIARNASVSEYERLLKHKSVNNKDTDIQFTFSTMIVEDAKLSSKLNSGSGIATIDFICADFEDNDRTYLVSGGNSLLRHVYVGTIPYTNSQAGVIGVKNQTETKQKSSTVNMHEMYSYGEGAQIVAFQKVFSGWSIKPYWSIKPEKYFPLLINETVDNFIEIDSAEDLQFIRANPNGNFRIVKDFTINASDTDSNWVIGGENPFTGILIGERKTDKKIPVITITGLTPTIKETSGFFRETRGATITNLTIVWNHEAIQPGFNVDLLMVSGFICEDTNSLISNIEVRVGQNNTGKLIKPSTNSIGGFGGIVGVAINTNILGCTFIGEIDANIKNSNVGLFVSDVYVGGIVGYSATNRVIDPQGSAVINDCKFGASGAGKYNYSLSSLTLTINAGNEKAVYVGGIVGYSNNSSCASSNLGSKAFSAGYEKISITVICENTAENLYVGGIAGYASSGMIFSCNALTNITVYGNTTANSIYIGGVAGQYAGSGTATYLTNGIVNTNSESTISTYVADDPTTTTENDPASLTAGTVFVSTGVAKMSGAYAQMLQCLILGEIKTDGSSITIVYAGGAVASGEGLIQEVITNAVIEAGSAEYTLNVYAGGIVGNVSGKLEINNSASWGRIIPITKEDASEIYVGGIAGRAEAKTTIKNTYTLSTLILDSVGTKSISNEKLKTGALIGGGEKPTFEGVVYYSSDIAMSGETNSDANLKNLSASVMYGCKWVESFNSNKLWTELNFSEGVSSVPYVSALAQPLRDFKVLSTSGDYNEGTSMRPVVLEDGDTIPPYDPKYTYYLFDTNITTIPNIKDLNGVLFGLDKTINIIDSTTNTIKNNHSYDGSDYSGAIPVILKHSAVSNLNINLYIEGSLNSSNTFGMIAGLNEGVIFNCSVQGYVKALTGGVGGLIAGVNYGLISHSYSSAEIVESTAQLGGIVHTNGGKLSSNYFVGYINGSETAGILMNIKINNLELNNFAFNNYMAGVIVGNNNAKSNFAYVDDFKGSNNFIDKYSNISKQYNDDNKPDVDILKIVETSALMSGGLAGNWYYTVEAVKGGGYQYKQSDKDSEGKTIDLRITAETFGYNYNYPIYRFNKISNWGEQTISDLGNKLFTGTGEASESLKSGRYNNLTDETLDEYDKAFKIPHLGVLYSINSLMKFDLNYVLIYPIDGKPYNDTEEVNYKNESSVGDESAGGFSNIDSVNMLFQGVFISNKYYLQSDEICVITNLQGKGLFNNIENAYFADLDFGTFTNLEGSGPLGATIKDKQTVTAEAYYYVEVDKTIKYKQNDDGTFEEDSSGEYYKESGTENIYHKATEFYEWDLNTTQYVGNIDGTFIKLQATPVVIVNNVTLKQDSIIQATAGYYGGLFGENKGELEINTFVVEENVVLQDEGCNATVGLICGKSSGNIELIASAVSSFKALFSGNAIAGGVVGEMSGGTITGGGESAKIEFVTNTDKVLSSTVGGVAGKTSGKSLIENVVISLPEELKINSFGGIVGKVEGSTTVDDCTITSESDNVTMLGANGVSEATERFFGFVAGEQKADLECKIKIEGIENLKVCVVTETDTNGNNKYSVNLKEEESNSGVGLFVGKLTSGEFLTNLFSEDLTINLEAEGIPNLGGLVGYFTGGNNCKFIIETLDNLEKLKLTLSGSTNVGGAFGYSGNISSKTFTSEGNVGSVVSEIDHVLNNSNFKPTISLEGSIIYDKSNIGGLIGFFGGSNAESTSEPTGEPNGEPTDENTEYIKIESNATINIYSNGIIKNVGGVFGKLTGNASNVTNSAGFAHDNLTNKEVVIESAADNSTDEQYVKLMNVGGVAGYLAGGYTLTNVKNNDKTIIGYQNVGAIAGYVGQGATIQNVLGEYLTLDAENNLQLLEYVETDGKLYANDGGSYIEDDNGTYLKVSKTGEFIEKTDDMKAHIVENGEIKELDTGTYYSQVVGLTTKPLIKGSIYGVVNVGGVAGFTDKGATIDQIYVSADVYGNVNVGGLVGLSNESTLKNNLVQLIEQQTASGSDPGTEPAPASTTEEQPTGFVKGIYYQYNELDTDPNVFIPTNVGGLLGGVFKSMLNYNVLDGVEVTSSKEGESAGKNKMPMISTYKNNMADIISDSENIIGKTNSDTYDFLTNTNKDGKETVYELKDQKIRFASVDRNKESEEYNDVRTGYGGFAGSIDTTTIQNLGANNMKDINVFAELGINVGTYIGAYRYTGDVSVENTDETKLITIKTPNLYSSLNNDILIDGAYNIGGVIGFIDTPTNMSVGRISNDNLTGSATVKIQTRLTGFYVGGLIGKTNAKQLGSSTSEFEMIADDTNDIKIKLSTTNSYYIGGVIGRAEIGDVSVGAVYAKVTGDNLIESGSDAENFGGLVGMLKVGENEDGVAVSVIGSHSYPFTVNTIENCNYADGASTYNALDDDNIQLYAQAHYINMDEFKISAGNFVDIQFGYGGKLGVDYYYKSTSPLDSTVSGWAKEYTMFKAIQRYIPKEDNNGADWESVAILYDAVNIKGVGVDGSSNIIYTIYEEEFNSPNVYTKDGIYFALKDEKQELVTGAASYAGNYRVANAIRLKGYANPGDVSYTNYMNSLIDVYLETFNYCGQQVVFLKEVVYENPNESSGSIFNVNGVGNDLYAGYSTKVESSLVTGIQNGLNWIKKVLTGEDGKEKASAYRHNIGHAFTKIHLEGVKCIFNWISQTKHFFKESWKVITGEKTWGGALFEASKQFVNSLRLLNVSKQDVAEKFFINGDKVTEGDYDDTCTKQNFAKEQQQYGLLSNMYTRKLDYQNVDGKYSEVFASDDMMVYKGFDYHVVEGGKPAKFNDERFALLEFASGDPSSGDSSIGIEINKTTYYFAKDEGTGNVKVQPISYREITTKNTSINGGNIQGWDVVDFEGKTYLKVDFYMFYEGKYWVNSLVAGEEVLTPTTNFFDPQDMSPEMYIQTSMGNYVYGTYNADGTYSFRGDNTNYVTSNNKSKAEVKYKNSTGGISGNAIITNNLTEKSKIKFVPASNQGYDFGNDDSYILGYNYMQGAYYTAMGTDGLKIKNEGVETELVKTATFELITDNGTQPDGVNIIKHKYKLEWVQSSSGNFLKISETGDPTQDYVEIIAQDRYDTTDDGETFDQKDDGMWLKVGDDYKQIIPEGVGANCYLDYVEEYGLFKIAEDTEFVDGNSENIILRGNKIKVAVYPYSFKNPYKDDDGDAMTIANSCDGIHYVANQSATDAMIHEAEYFLWIGGFIYEDGKVYVEDDDPNIGYEEGKFYYAGSDAYSIMNEDGTEKEMSYDKIYKRANNSNYRLTSEYVLHLSHAKFEDCYGRLCSKTLSFGDYDDVQGDPRFGKYLSSVEFNLYTRYKYSDGLVGGSYITYTTPFKEDGTEYWAVPAKGNLPTTELIEVVKVNFVGGTYEGNKTGTGSFTVVQ